MLELFTPFARVRDSTVAIAGVVTFGVLIGLWALSPIALIPNPAEVFTQLRYLIEKRGLLAELGTSMRLNLEALTISTVVALAFSYAFSMPAFRPLVRVLAGFRFWGLIGFVFIFFILIADTHMVKIVVVVFGMTPYFITSMAEVIEQISDDELNHARTLKMGPWQTLWEVGIRGKLDRAIETMAQCAAIAWMMTAMIEGMLRTEGGLGVMLVEQNRYLKIADILAIQFTILVFGLSQYFLLRFARNKICGYAIINKGGAK